jgi:hypothetical protein
MRYLFAFALICLSPFAMGEAIICPDGVTYGDGTVADCPVNSTSPSITDVTQTTANITATADAQAATPATAYHWTASTEYPPGCSSLNYQYSDLSSPTPSTKQAAIKARQKCMKWPDIVAGTGATVYGSATVSAAGSYAIPITGLSSGTSYYTHHLVKGGAAGAGKIGLLESQLFVTNSAGAPPGETTVQDSGASPRYIGTGGSDGNDGLTHATRWLTLSKVTGALPAGTNVGILNSSTFTNQELKISHAGTSLDRNIIGSYKLNASSIPIWTVDGVFGISTTDTKAIIEGGLTQGCLTAGSCAYAGTFPIDTHSDAYDAPVFIYHSADYTTLQNIEVRFVRYRSMTVGSEYNKTLVGVIVDGVDVHDSGDNPFWVGNLDSVARNNTFYNLNTCKMQRSQAGATGSVAACNYAGWPGGLQIIRSNRVLVENNFVRDVFGEGINSYNDSRYVVIRGNTVGDVHSTGIYVDYSSQTVIENNIVIMQSSNNVGYATSGGPSKGGIYVDFEHGSGAFGHSGNTQDQVIRNNLVVNAGLSLLNSMWPEAVTADTGSTRYQSGYYLGNTVVGATSRDMSQNEFRDIGTRLLFWEARNNIGWSQGLGASACSWRDHGAEDFTTYNHWYTAQTDADCNSANDSTGAANLTVSNYATWQAYSIDGTIPTWANATPSGAGGVNQTGVAYTTPILDIANFGIAFTQIAEVLAGTLTESEWEGGLVVDALGATRANPPSKGAVE